MKGTGNFPLSALIFLLLCLVILPFQARAQDEEDTTPVKVDTLLFTIPLTVSDKKGVNVAGLKKEDFTIYEDGLAQPVELFLNEDAPMNVAILLDTSYSTRDVLDNIQKAARDFVKILRPEDRAVIVSFDDRTVFLSCLESDRKVLDKAIEKVRVSSVNGSDMYDAMARVTQNYFADLKGRKAIIALTDGMVTGRGTSAQQTLDTLHKNDIFFYPIIFRNDSNSAGGKRPKKTVLIEILQIMATETGGRFYEKDSTKLKEAFQAIAEDLKYQYLLGFYPRNTKTGTSRVRVAIDRDELFVKTKKRLD